jgi:hypothetical protein
LLQYLSAGSAIEDIFIIRDGSNVLPRVAEGRTILNKQKSPGRRSMTRHLKIGHTLETISFARGSRVEREFGREIGADMGKEKEG